MKINVYKFIGTCCTLLSIISIIFLVVFFIGQFNENPVNKFDPDLMTNCAEDVLTFEQLDIEYVFKEESTTSDCVLE